MQPDGALGSPCGKLNFVLGELIDTAVLEDFAGGLALAAGVRASVYGARGRLIATAEPRGNLQSASPLLEELPQRLALRKLLPAREPPASVAFVRHDQLMTLVVPVHVNKSVAGFIALGAFQDPKRRPDPADDSGPTARTAPALEQHGDARPVVLGRWASRMLADWCLSEARHDAAAGELALLGDIGELLSGERDLQTVLDHIVAETARVMNLQYCTLRLYDRKTNDLTVRAGYNVLETQGSEPTILRSDNPIDDAALSGEMVYIDDATSDPRIQFAEEAKRLGIVSGLAAGMIYRGEPVGVLRVYANYKKRFRTRHRNLLRAVASQAAIAVANSRLLEARLRSAMVDRQLKTAGAVQARMIRTPPPVHPRLDSALVFEPSSHVGGDFCDIFTLDDGKLAAVVGDVVGHGVPAALLMASARGALRAAARHCADLAELVALLNQHVHRETTSSEFVTLLLIAVNESATELCYVNAGHEPLLLLRNGVTQSLGDSNLVLGIDPNERYETHNLDLRPGDFILLYTDGVVEAMTFEGEIFGRHRLYNALEQYGALPPDQTLRNIRWDVRRYAGLAEQSDDLTMVGLRVREA